MQVQKTAQLTGHNAAIYALSAGRSERHFLSAAGDGWVVEWDFADPENGRLIAKVEAKVFSLFFLKNENLLVAGNMGGGVHWVDLAEEKLTKNIAHHTKGVFGVCRAGPHVFTAGGEGKLTRWSVGERRALESYHLANQSLRAVVFSKKRNELAVGSSDNSIYFLDAETLEIKHHIVNAHGNSVFTLRYSPDGNFLLSGGRDAFLKAWSLAGEYAELASFPAHNFTVNDIAFHPGGHLIATASRDKTVKIWDAQNFKLMKVLEGARDGGHFNSVNCLLWSEFEDTLVSAGDDRSIVLWKF